MKKVLIVFIFFTQLLHSAPETRVAIFGSNYNQQNIANDPLLAKLLASIKTKSPTAVFFTGTFENPDFEKNLMAFSKVKDTYLGKDVPFYPTLGNSQQSNFEIIETFREHFNIQKISPRPPYHLAYTVSIQESDFIVLATGFDEPEGKDTLPILDWLNKYLETNAKTFKYRFVLSHFPAFSSTAPTGVYLGLDKDPVTRDIFWGILRRNHVNAYFCSYEPFYDRSNRDEVWQIISGGIVNRFATHPESRTFSHYLLLIWGEGNEFPVLKVFDIEGMEWDSFKLIPSNFPVHQMRISDKF